MGEKKLISSQKKFDRIGWTKIPTGLKQRAQIRWAGIITLSGRAVGIGSQSRTIPASEELNEGLKGLRYFGCLHKYTW